MTKLDFNFSKRIIQKLAKIKLENKKIVLVTGVFDILHPEHRKFLEKAKLAGDFLLVGLETDLRVRALKGPDRPINSAQIRLKNLKKLLVADEVFILPENFQTDSDHETLISLIKPDVLAVSSHTAFLAKKAAILQKYGGQVIVVHEHNPEQSTTKILKHKI